MTEKQAMPAEPRYCECAKPFITQPREGYCRPWPMANRWPDCRACGRQVRVEVARFLEDVPIAGPIQ